MSTQHVRVLVPPPVAEPRGARLAARIALGLSRFGKATWCTLEEIGRRRAARELKRIGRSVESTDPALARTLRGATDGGTTY